MEQTPRKSDDWMHREVVDLGNHRIGSVDDVLYEEASGRPEWVLVKTGMFGAKRTFVPASHLHLQDDKLAVPYGKDKVKDAPRIDHGEHLTDDEERGLFSYYGLQYEDSAPAGAVAGSVPGTPAASLASGDGANRADGEAVRLAPDLIGREKDEVARTVRRPCELVSTHGQMTSQPGGFMLVAPEEIRCDDSPVEVAKGDSSPGAPPR